MIEVPENITPITRGVNRRFIDLTGKKFGRFTVVSVVGTDRFRAIYWLCQCECGAERIVRTYELTSGNSQSCGCLHSDIMRRISLIHGHNLRRGPSREYQSWHNMKQRCLNPRDSQYHNYGGRGIRICDRWMDFQFFLADMGVKPSPHHTLERINNEGNYEPTNCRWATRLEQMNNTRHNHRLSFQGSNLTISEWSRRTGLTINAIRKRIQLGHPISIVLDPNPLIRTVRR